MTRAQTHIQAMAPYALADLSSPERVPLISLSQNESLRSPSPLAIEAATHALADSALYPDPDWTNLRTALGQHHRLDPKNILCGNGSLDLISCLARCFAGPDRAVLAPAHAYPFFRTVAQMSNAPFHTAPEIEATASVDALLRTVRRETGLLFIANPGNPTGTRIPISELKRLRAALRDDILLVIDEAYGEFADHLGERVFDMVTGGNTVVLRTFSKAYGLAGCRVGWGVFPINIAIELRKIMNPNSLTTMSEAAAMAALNDDAYMRETCSRTIELRDGAAARLQKAGYKIYPSFTNFLLIDLETPAEAIRIDHILRGKGIFLRPQDGAGLPHCLRMTVGPSEHMEKALEILEAEKRAAT